MTSRIRIGGISVDRALFDFTENSLLRDTGITAQEFWTGFSKLVSGFGPRIRHALAERDRLQAAIDHFLAEHGNGTPERQVSFLREIGYLENEPEPFSVSPQNTDAEIGEIAGPQLVVPVNNARYALNAANARWGSLYDAFYGTDAIPQAAPLAPGRDYNPLRGRAVVRRVRLFLDETFPLRTGSHADVTRYYVQHGDLHAALECGRTTGLHHPMQFAGFRGNPAKPDAILLKNHNLHVEIQIDRTTPVGSTDLAGITDVLTESALSTIMDCEDSVAAVDVTDKLLVYRNWLGLMRGTLSASFTRDGTTMQRTLAKDRAWTTPEGGPLTLPGRSLMLVRTVGFHMFTDAVLDTEGQPVPENLLDAAIVSAAALHDLNGNGPHRNSRAGAVYIVRPKMHGSAEVALSDAIFAGIEDMLRLGRNTLRMGLMDEERRTSANLAGCIHAARERIFFINTGFLDRTGDEIHTCMKAGPVVRKGDMKSATWISAYEQRNAATGLACGLRIGPRGQGQSGMGQSGKGQIGKGMWAMPDQMSDMLATKGAQLRAGASTAWVPSPTAATLHALHYHETDVAAVQRDLGHRPARSLEDLLTLPLAAPDERWSEEEIARELDTNLQSILGYVVRWVDMGVGCSRVPDLNNVGLMEDRATLRISSQHVANWLMHGIVTVEQVDVALARMARIVDEQNSGEPGYIRLSTHHDGPAYMAARDLIFSGDRQPNGYTEAVLHARRREAKALTHENGEHHHEPERAAG